MESSADPYNLEEMIVKYLGSGKELYDIMEVDTLLRGELVNLLVRIRACASRKSQLPQYVDVTHVSITSCDDRTSTKYIALCKRHYSCQISATGTCCFLLFPVGDTYNRVCGCIRAYQFGIPDGFAPHHVATLNIGINEPYLTGISITHRGILGMSPTDGGTAATHI